VCVYFIHAFQRHANYSSKNKGLDGNDARYVCGVEFLSLETENGREKAPPLLLFPFVFGLCVDTGDGDGLSYFAYTYYII